MPLQKSAAKVGARSSGQRDTLAGFARFLKRYLSAWPVIVACLIGPITKYLHLVPTYKDHENVLACVTALYGFIVAAALFYYRPTFRLASGRRKARWRSRLVLLMPAILILASIGALFRYIVVVQDSIQSQRDEFRELGVESAQLGAQDILARSDLTNIPNGTALLVWYLVAFLAAETSLVVMALVEFTKTEAAAP